MMATNQRKPLLPEDVVLSHAEDLLARLDAMVEHLTDLLITVPPPPRPKRNPDGKIS